MNKILDKLYDVFSKFNLQDLQNVGFYDYGPSSYELEAISRPIRKIPNKAIESMEFFGYDDSWGTKEQVKYLLPRLFEYLYEDISRLENPGFFSYFKYKLRDSIKPHSDLFNEEEREIIIKYFKELFKINLFNNLKIGYLIECALAVGFSPKEFINLWKPNPNIFLQQMVNLFDHFEITELSSLNYAKGVYYEDTKKTGEILNLAFSELTDNQRQDIEKKINKLL